jgi:hypothetical protein
MAAFFSLSPSRQGPTGPGAVGVRSGGDQENTGEFRTRAIQDGVHPSLHIGYKNFDLKQYFKEGRG